MAVLSLVDRVPSRPGISRKLGQKRRRWKKVELEIARWLGAERVPVSGRQRGFAPDIEHPWLAIEVKSWLRLPGQVANAMDQAEKAASWLKRTRGVDRLPVAIIHGSYAHWDNSLVVMRLKDAEAWFGVRSAQPPALEEPASSEGA